MNILYIEHYVGSPYYGMEFRPYYLSKEWVKAGHQVTIIGSSFSHLRQNNPVVNKDFQEEIVDGVKYVWFKGNSYEGSFSRIRNMLSFVWKLQHNAKRIVELYKPDLVVASSTYTLDNFPAYKIAKQAGAKYSYEIHDLWPLSPMLIGGYSKFHPFIMLMQLGENYAYRHVDKVVSLLWNAEEHCKEHGLPDGRFICVPNGFSKEEWKEEVFASSIPEEHEAAFDSLKDKFVVGFAGGFAASGTIDTLVEAANIVKDRKDIHFVLVGKGPEEKTYRGQIERYNLSNVTILPPVPKSIVPAINKRFDAAFIGGVHSILHKYGTAPNKVTDYMLSAKPIIQAIDEPGSVVERIHCGLRTEAENAEQVAKAIITIADMTPEERLEMGMRGRLYALDNLEWGLLANKFIKEFE